MTGGTGGWDAGGCATSHPRDGVAGTVGVLSKPTDERAVQTAVDYALRRRRGEPIQYAPPELQLFG